MTGSPADVPELAPSTISLSAPPGSAVAIRGGALRVLGYGSGVLISLGAATILVRHLGIQGFGHYVTVTSLVALVGGLTEAGIIVYGIREFVVRDERDRRQLMSNLLAMRLTLTLFGIISAVCFGLLTGYGGTVVLGILVVGVGLLAQVVSDVLSISLQAQLMLGRLTIAELSRRTLTLLLIAIMALAGAKLLPLLAAPSVATVTVLFLIAWMVRSHVTIRLEFDRKIWGELLAKTLPFAIAISIAVIYFYVTIIVMSSIATATQTGLFATSFRVTQVVLAIPSLLLTAIFPLISALHTDRTRDVGTVIGRVLTMAVICGAGMSLAMALGASFIVGVIAGAKGHGAISVLRIQGLVFVLSFVSTAGALILVSLQRYRPLIVASSCALALNILLAVVLIPELGARGGAIADVLTEAMVAGVYTLTLVRTLPDHGISARFLPPVLTACVAASSVLLVPMGSLARAISATVIYGAVLLLMGAIPQEVIDAARRLRARPPLS